MRRLAPPHHGTVSAVGFLIDRSLVGEAQARQRVLERWILGASLKELDERRWILLLPKPEEVNCHAAPGLPLLVDDVSHGRLHLLDQGRRESLDLADLPTVHPGQWLSTDHLQLISLIPCEAPPPVTTAVEHLIPAREVNLREKAAVRARSTKSSSAVREMTEASRKTGKDGGGGSKRSDRAPRDRLARLLLRSPAAGQISRRHAKYLEELTRSFERRDYDSALRHDRSATPHAALPASRFGAGAARAQRRSRLRAR